MGRPKKPTNIKLLSGTAQKCRMNKNEPSPDHGLPGVPAHFVGKTEEKWWNYFGKQLAAMRVMTLSDVSALELLCEAKVDHDAAREKYWTKDIMNGGVQYDLESQAPIDDGKIQLKKNPYPGIVSERSRMIKEMLIQFGLTPASRANVSTVSGNEKENPYARYLNRKK